MIDTHCHLTFPEFRGRTAQILTDAAEVGVRGAITIATTTADCLRAMDLADAHPNLWFSAGVHPLHSDEPLDWEVIRNAPAHPKCVAWGELGLDNHYDRPHRKMQDRVLAEQLALIEGFRLSALGCRRDDHDRVASQSSDTGGRTPSADRQEPKAERREQIADRRQLLPIIVHCRDAFDDLLAVFRSAPFEPSAYVFHCFTGTPADARKVLDFGAWISFTGVVTFANAPQVAEAAKLVPQDRIMVETDSPFLTPEPVRKIRPNEPKFVVHIARRLAELRGVEYDAFERQLDDNARRFFGIRF
jgi:TatD DNase family protein